MSDAFKCCRQEIIDDTAGIDEPYDYEASAEEREGNDELNPEDNIYDTYNSSAVDFDEVYAKYCPSETTEQPSRLRKLIRSSVSRIFYSCKNKLLN